MFYNRQQSEHQGGFTLVEIMIALVVFSVIMLGLAAGLIAATKTNRQNVLRDEALRLAEEELSRLNGELFTDSGGSGNLAAGAWTAPVNVAAQVRSGVSFVRSTRITDLGGAPVMVKLIDVAVGWDAGGSAGAAIAPTQTNRQVAMSTIIARIN